MERHDAVGTVADENRLVAEAPPPGANRAEAAEWCVDELLDVVGNELDEVAEVVGEEGADLGR